MRCEAKLAKRGYWLKSLRRTSSTTWCAVRHNWQKWKLLSKMLTQNKFSNLMRYESKLAKVEAINWNAYAEQVQQPDAFWGQIGKKGLLDEMLTRNKLSNLMRCEAKLWKVEANNWIFRQNKFSNLMRCEAKFAKVEVINWIFYAEQVQQLDALWGKIGKKRGYWLKCLRGRISAT